MSISGLVCGIDEETGRSGVSGVGRERGGVRGVGCLGGARGLSGPLVDWVEGKY